MEFGIAYTARVYRLIMGPPKCKTCGKVEWRHVCRGTVSPYRRVQVAGKTFAVAAGPTLTISSPPPAKPTRKEYLALKARERRARQKASS